MRGPDSLLNLLSHSDGPEENIRLEGQLLDGLLDGGIFHSVAIEIGVYVERK